jgi:hypothetical protein
MIDRRHVLFAAALLLLGTARANIEESHEPAEEEVPFLESLGYYVTIALLLALAALCSGLTVGYTSFDRIEL